MSESFEHLQQKLENLETGQPLDDGLEGLDENEQDLVQLAAEIRKFEPPDRNPEVVAQQLQKMKRSDTRKKRPPQASTNRTIFPRKPLLVPAVALTLLVMVACITVVGLGFGGWAISRLNTAKSERALVQEILGTVEYQASDGSWQPVNNRARLSAGTQLRTGELSGAQLEFQDGSVLQLDPSTAITLDQMDRFFLGSRMVRITQWEGETKHEVPPNKKAASLYEVRTPAATLTAQGTAFTVQVQVDLRTRVSVDAGFVDVTGAQSTISLEAGQTSSVSVGQTPTEPAFLVRGAGILTISGNSLTVAGEKIILDETIEASSQSQPGDRVTFEGRLLPDGNLLVEHLDVLQSTQGSAFMLAGEMEAIANTALVVEGQFIHIDPQMEITAEVASAEKIVVAGQIAPDGTWVANTVESVDEAPAEASLEFSGMVESLDPWVVSGIQLVVDADTEMDGEIVLGSMVHVEATWQPNSVWHADEISLLPPEQIGCVTLASVITAIAGDLVSLENGLSINLNDVETIEGELEVGSTVLVTKCLWADETITFPLIQVIASPPFEPTATATSIPTSTPGPESVILPNCYQITFLSFTENGEGTSTWRYQVDELSCAQDLSNWMLELPSCASVVAASPSPWEIVNPDPNFQLHGIKWETGTGFQQGEFSVTLSGELILGTVQVGAKGPDVALGLIAGPACASATATPTPTLTFTPSPTVTLTTTPTLTITPTLTLTPTPTIPATATATSMPTATPLSPTQPPPSAGTIYVTDNNQTLAYTCNGNAVVISGNANTVTLLGACSSITVRGNGNTVYWQLGSPTITNTGNENQIIQK